MVKRNQFKLILTKEYLEKEYLKNNKSAFEISNELGCTPASIYKYIRLFKIKLKKTKRDFKKLIGKRIGSLTIIKKLGKYDGRHYGYLVRCDCGNEKAGRINEIYVRKKKGLKIACETCLKFKNGKYYNYQGYKDLPLMEFNRVKIGAIKRKLEFNLDIKYLWNLYIKQNKKCIFTGLNIGFGSRYKKDNITASLDRIDSSKGYIKGNVQWVHKEVNFMKYTLKQDRFIELCKLVSQQMLKKKSIIGLKR